MELVGCPEISVRKNYYVYMLRNNLEESRPHLHHGGSLKSRIKIGVRNFLHSFLILLHFIPDFRLVVKTQLSDGTRNISVGEERTAGTQHRYWRKDKEILRTPRSLGNVASAKFKARRMRRTCRCRTVKKSDLQKAGGNIMDAVWQKSSLISEDFSILNATAFARQHKGTIVFPLAFILYENALKIKPLKHEKISYVALQLVSVTIMARFKVKYHHRWELCRITHSVCTHITTRDKGNTGKKEIGGRYRENLTFDATAASQSECSNSYSKKWW